MLYCVFQVTELFYYCSIDILLPKGCRMEAKSPVKLWVKPCAGLAAPHRVGINSQPELQLSYAQKFTAPFLSKKLISFVNCIDE